MTEENTKVKSRDSREILQDWLAEYFSKKGAKYELKVQLGTSPEHHPTEDASVVWDEATAPYQTIAVLEFDAQDPFQPERRVFWEDRMVLSPWAGLVDHQPLGSINRFRKYVYAMSRPRREKLIAIPTKNINSVEGIL